LKYSISKKNLYYKNKNDSKKKVKKSCILESIMPQVINIFSLLNVRLKKNPGYPIGIIAGQSISEPVTQMTLKSFHFTGHHHSN